MADADRIVTVARWAQLEENALWLTSVGEVLRLSDNVKLAIEFGTSATKKDEKLATAYISLAETY